jgi:TolB-like protein/DNA-binding winged helix-turn-helix (wHTH) protein/Flp pilus assembly protein TadD
MTSPPVGVQQSIPFGEDFVLDLRPRRLRRGRHVLKLERIPLEILLQLLERAGETVTREEIVARVWGNDVFLDTDNSIRGAIRKIRHELKDDPDQPRFIQTVTGKGYRFIAPVGQPGEGPDIAAGQERRKVGPETPDATAIKGELRVRGHYGWLATGLAVVVVLGLAYFVARSRHTEADAKIKSLAVLPLKNLSGNPGQDYLADAMTEELIGRLASIHDLRVISRTSVMQFQDTKETVPAIAKKLGVDAVVEGSVIRDGNRIRVHAQLIRASNDEHFWSETYDRELGDVQSLQSDIAQSIVQKVEVTVSGQERALLVARRQVSPEAYESFLKGSYANFNTSAGIEQGIDFFQEAIRKDPTFAPAYVGLARAYGTLSMVFAGVPPQESRLKVISAAQKALELDPGLAGAHVLLGQTYERLWKWSESSAELKRALELQPNDADANRELAMLLVCEGRTEEGIVRLQRARELDPINVDALVNDGFLLFLARHYDEAIQTLRSVLAVQPDIARAHWFMGYNLIAKGQPELAIPELEKAVVLSDRSPAVIGVLVRAYAHVGRRADALRLLAELKKRSQAGYVPAGAFINAYLGLGDKEQAFVWLERGYEEKSGIMPLLKAHPHFDPIRNDPRFADLIHRLGLDREYSSSF